MSTNLERRVLIEMRHELEAIRGNWFWFLLLGIALIVFGMMALSAPWVASLAGAMTLGFFILFGGVAESIGAFWSRAWSGFFLHLLSGILGIVVGVLFLRRPGDAMVTLTLLIACFLLVGGAFKIVGALAQRFPAWGWTLLSGVIDVLLGLLIWMEWPASALWVIGLFVGISLIFQGTNWVAIALAVRSIPRATAGAAGTVPPVVAP